MTTVLDRIGVFRTRVPTIYAAGLVMTAMLCAAASIGVAFDLRTQPLRALIDELFVPAPANVAYAVFLMVLAAGINNRKRVAFRLLLGLFTLEAAADAVIVGDRFRLKLVPLEWEETTHWPSWFLPHLTIGNLVITIALMVMLVWAHGEFTAKVRRASTRRAVATFAGLLVTFWFAGWLLVEAFPGTLRSTRHRAVWTLERIVGGAFSFDVTRHGRAPGWINLVLGLFGAITLLVSMWVLLRAQRAHALLDPAQERQIRALLDAHGEADSLGYFATRRDKQVIFSPSGTAAVTYRVVAGVTLASGDPIGDRDGWQPAIDAWLSQAREYAWTPAVMGASESGAHAYARAGLRALELGDEAILHTDRFTTDGPQMRQVRHAVARVTRAGYTVRIRRHEQITRQEMSRIIDLAARWRGTETERGFSMALGRLGDSADGQCVLVEALDAAGREAAVLSFVPWGTTGLSLDLMRRDHASDNGLIETMIVALLRQAPELGVQRVSLNFAVFRSAFENGARIGAGPVLIAWRRLLLLASRWFQLESLYRSNVKYRPEWLPRFLCFEDVRDLPKVSLASGAAEGFLVAPSLPTLLRRGTAQPRQDESQPQVPQPDPAPVPAARDAEAAGAHLPRAAKLDPLRAGGLDPYPPTAPRTHTCAEIRAANEHLEAGTSTGTMVTIAGRVVALRRHGRLTFATVRDAGGDLQAMLTADRLGEDELQRWRCAVDVGDIVTVTGEVIVSRRGELTVHATGWSMASKCLRSPSAQADTAPPLLRTRSAAVHAIRTTLIDRGFTEVDTPILRPVPDGSDARPFVTRGKTYDLPLYLRAAPERYLERLLVEGAERVFEVGRSFRDEASDAAAGPESTMLEACQAYADYADLRGLARDLVTAAAIAANGSPHARRSTEDGSDVETIDIAGEWPAVPVYDAISKAVGELIDPTTMPNLLHQLATAAQVSVGATAGHDEIVLDLYERLVEAVTWAPTFYVDFPGGASPLARAHRDDPRLAERWSLVAFGSTIATARSVLTDPIEQRRRLASRTRHQVGCGPAATRLDEDYLTALEHALPPTASMTVDLDRLVAMLTGASVRQVRPFTMTKPRGRTTPRAH